MTVKAHRPAPQPLTKMGKEEEAAAAAAAAADAAFPVIVRREEEEDCCLPVDDIKDKCMRVLIGEVRGSTGARKLSF